MLYISYPLPFGVFQFRVPCIIHTAYSSHWPTDRRTDIFAMSALHHWHSTIYSVLCCGCRSFIFQFISLFIEKKKRIEIVFAHINWDLFRYNMNGRIRRMNWDGAGSVVEPFVRFNCFLLCILFRVKYFLKCKFNLEKFIWSSIQGIICVKICQ